MTNPIRIAILGAGRWGTHLIRNFNSHPDAEVVAVVDPDVKQLKTVQERLQLNPNIVLETDGLTVMNQCELDAVAVVTPASTHYLECEAGQVDAGSR